MTRLAVLRKTTTSASLAGERKMEPNTGLSATHGAATGVKTALSESSGESTIWELSTTAHGPPPLTPGQRTSETRPNRLLKMPGLSLLFVKSVELADVTLLPWSKNL